MCTCHGAHVEIEDNWGNLVLDFYLVSPGEPNPSDCLLNYVTGL